MLPVCGHHTHCQGQQEAGICQHLQSDVLGSVLVGCSNSMIHELESISNEDVGNTHVSMQAKDPVWFIPYWPALQQVLYSTILDKLCVLLTMEVLPLDKALQSNLHNISFRDHPDELQMHTASHIF